MNLQDFKQQNNLSSIGLYPSTKSDRSVGTVMIKGEERTILTTVGFDSTQPAFVYNVEVADESTGEMVELFVISNKAPKEPALVL